MTATISVVNFVSLDGVMQSVLSPDEDREGGFELGGWVSQFDDPTLRNTTVLGPDPISDVQLLRREIEGTIVVFGSDELVRALTAADLIDEYCLLVFPLILGTRKRLFARGSPPHVWRSRSLSPQLPSMRQAASRTHSQTFRPSGR